MKLLLLLGLLVANALAQPLISYHTPKGWYVYNVQGKAILTPTTQQLASPPSLFADRYLRAELLVKMEGDIQIVRYVLIDDQGKTCLNNLPGNLKPTWVWKNLVGVVDVASSFSGVVSLTDGKVLVKPVYTQLTPPAAGKYLFYNTPDRQCGAIGLTDCKVLSKLKGYEYEFHFEDLNTKQLLFTAENEEGEEKYFDPTGKEMPDAAADLEGLDDEDMDMDLVDKPAGMDFELVDNGRGGVAMMREDDTLTANLTITTQPQQVCNGLMVYADKTNPSLTGVATLTQQVVLAPAVCNSIDIYPYALIRTHQGGKMAIFTLQGKPLLLDDLANADRYHLHGAQLCGGKNKWPSIAIVFPTLGLD